MKREPSKNYKHFRLVNYSKFASNIGCPNIWNEKATEHDDFHPRNGWFEADDVSGSASEFAFRSRWTSNFVSPESALEHGKVLDVFRLPSGQTSLAQKKPWINRYVDFAHEVLHFAHGIPRPCLVRSGPILQVWALWAVWAVWAKAVPALVAA